MMKKQGVFVLFVAIVFFCPVAKIRAQDLPDLIVDGAYVETTISDAGVPLNTIHVDIRNIGKGTSHGRFEWHVSFTKGDEVPISFGQGQTYLGDFITSDITPGGLKSVTIAQGSYLPRGTTHLLVTADAKPQTNGDILESDEKNNKKLVPLPAPELPDLVVENAYLESIVEPSGLTRNTLHVDMRNIGKGFINKGTQFEWHVSFTNGDKTPIGFGPGGRNTFFGDNKVLYDFLRPGQLTQGTVIMPTPPVGATHWSITVDAAPGGGEISESDEKNNSKLIPMPARQLPDLVVEDGFVESVIEPNGLTRNTLHVDIRNIGKGAIEPIANIEWHVSFTKGDETPIGFGPGGRETFFGDFLTIHTRMESNELRSTTTTMPTIPRDATHLLVTIDAKPPNGVIAESDEKNNKKLVPLPVPDLPDLTVERITFDSGKPQVFIKNIGKEAAFLGTTKDNALLLTVGWKDKEGNIMISGPESIEARRFTSGQWLLPGDSLTVGMDMTPPPGAVAAWAFIDNPDRVKESDECNNQLIVLIISQNTTADEMTSFDQKLLADRIAQGNPCIRITSTGTPGLPTIPGIRVPPIVPVELLDFGRNLRLALTFDNTKKVELLQQFSDKKLLEAVALANANKDKQATQRLHSYENDVQTILHELATLKETKPNAYAPLAMTVLENEVLHLAFIETLDKKTLLFRGQRDKLLETFGTLATTMDAKTVSQALAQTLDKNGSPLRRVQNIAILDMLNAHASGTIKQTIESFKQKESDYVQGGIRVVPPQQQTEQLPSTINWQSIFPPEMIKELNQSLEPIIEQIKALCGKIPQTDAEAQACAQKILDGSIQKPPEEAP